MKSTRATEISCYVGYITQAIVLNLLPLFFVIFQNDYKISTSQLSLTIFLTFFLQIGIDSVVAFFGERVNLRATAIAAHVFCAAGLISLAFLPEIIDPFIGILASVALYSVGSAFLEVVINPIFDRLPKKEDAGFTFAHSFYCWGQLLVILVSAVVLGFSNGRWRFIPLCWSIVPILNSIALAIVPIPEKESSEAAVSVKNGRLAKGFFLFIVVMICAGATEQCIAQWASYFAEKGLGTTKLVGDLLGPCLFALFMASGRTLFSLFGKRIKTVTALTFCALASAVCYIAVILIPSPFISLAACALSGLAISILWPATLDLTGEAFVCGTAAFSMLSLAGDVGCTAGPSVSGFVSDLVGGTEIAGSFASLLGISAEQASIRIGFAVSLLFPIVMFALLLVIKRRFFKKDPTLPSVTER